MTRPAPGSALDRVKLLLVTGLGSGLAPVAPGTFGSLAACLLLLLVPTRGFAGWCLGLIVVSTVACGLLGRFVARHFGREDPGAVVLDEFAGMFVTVLHPDKPGLLPLVLAFALFRVFDIVKPFPVRQAERLPGGWGIVADDLVAGLYANLILLILRLWVL